MHKPLHGKSNDACPEYAKRRRDFPTALREHLAQNGYSIDGAGGASVGATSPSFDCNKAQTPSEIQICRSPRLAELDNILAAGYAFLKTTQGRPKADEIGVPYWKLIAQCEGDEGCIARRQTEEISALARAGAPVSLPIWLEMGSGCSRAPINEPFFSARARGSEADRRTEAAGKAGTRNHRWNWILRHLGWRNRHKRPRNRELL